MIVFHGTTKENADKIKKEGFKPGCFFAKDINDSYKFGDHILIVKMRVKHKFWEIRRNSKVDKSKIIGEIPFINPKSMLYLVYY